MTIWQKLKKPGFAVGVVILIGFILFWGIPRWYLGKDIPFQSLELFPHSIKHYLLHLLIFPFDVFLRFMPWSLIAWPAFCVAYIPLDKNPIFSRFLRIIVISLFFLLWFSPFSESRDIIFLAPPLSVLCGINYWLLIRRKGRQIHSILKYITYTTIILGFCIIIFYTTSFPWGIKASFIPNDLHFRSSNMFIGLIQTIFAILLASFAIFKLKKRLTVVSHILIISISLSLYYWALVVPHRALYQDKKLIGHAFAKCLRKDLQIPKGEKFPDDLIVYKSLGNYHPRFVAPCLYMDVKVKKIHKLDQIPENIDYVYMIATEFPVSNKRVWEYVTPKKKKENEKNAYIFKKTRFYLLKGKIIKQETPSH